ncbi:hypothetical protein [Rickettsia rickettsii]|uniref:Uncharacterized protein n=2 Tax=Rickettsia rickettsii TaxID=783 RepID=B0BXV1_RICRO|nr:hypothetical protein [Rickettsia rickettsii]ABV76316.1 hypothetical protein A1G_04010 [Rickettsia rickettsii str. 'Sheila Smith']ABY72677.1 hypothetical protein RrIowa_0839 [Rickettsia rickettsii str. Iowa]AFB22111.1 hypothetical protein RPN_02945 [Rickettsia rickettsii str. Brazil]AFB23657.1 hypothetical protein RPL_03985 [Rickettsia rickettsii str. Colombia]AFB25002.1 hypothetical protein RPO_03985 [Rickettsia rickettsii str. Arizona]
MLRLNQFIDGLTSKLCKPEANCSLEGYEVDFILQNNYAFEVKIASSIQKNHLEGLLEFSKDSDFKLHIWTFSIELSIIKLID